MRPTPAVTCVGLDRGLVQPWAETLLRESSLTRATRMDTAKSRGKGQHNEESQVKFGGFPSFGGKLPLKNKNRLGSSPRIVGVSLRELGVWDRQELNYREGISALIMESQH